jgi:Trehalose utilisation
LTHKSPEPWAALVMSDNTRNFYGRSAGQVEQRYMANVFGAFRTAVEEHLPTNVINDWNLNAADLAKYKVVVLPNTACLDDAQVAALEEYVKNGGGLVASLDTSLFDEFGDARKNFALAKVLGVEYRGLPTDAGGGNDDIDVNFAKSIGPDYWEKRKNIFDFKQDTASILNQGKMKTYVGEESVTFKGAAVKVAVKSDAAKILGKLRARTPGAVDIPGVVANTYGKGRVVYFAAGFDSAYYLYAYPYQRLALKHAIEWAASAPSPLKVDAPMCVHSTFMRQSKAGAERLIVHLFNDLNTTAHHAFPNDDVPLREEVVPIRDIEITFAPQYRIRSIRLEPEGKALPMRKTDAGVTVTVPRLDVHSMVVAELDGAKK